ncbi:MAG: S-layer homology domain-containing protein [Patescibacteria group bacterium]
MAMKRLLIGVLVCLLMPVEGVVFAVTRSEAAFPDVSNGHENFAAIEALAEMDFVEGYSDGTFRPSRVINRAEAAAMIVRALAPGGVEPDAVQNRNCFSDVAEQWFARHVCFGKNDRNRWLKGYPGTLEFRPGSQIIVTEALRMAIDAFGIQHIAPISYLRAKWDVPLGYKNRPQDFMGKSEEWYYTYFVTAREFEFIDATTVANKLVTRAEFAEIIYRVWQFTQDGPTGFVRGPSSEVDFNPDGSGPKIEGDIDDPSVENDESSTNGSASGSIDSSASGTAGGTAGSGSASALACRVLGITPPVADPNAFTAAPYCAYQNSKHAHETQLWLGQVRLPSVWGQAFDFKYTSPDWPMALAYTAEKLDVNPNYLMAIAIKESRANCDYTNGCYQIGSAAFQDIKSRNAKYFDSDDDYGLVQPFGPATFIAGLFLNYTDRELWEGMYRWKDFWSSARDLEARVKILARGYNRGQWEGRIGTMLTTERDECVEATDVITACFPYSANTTTDPDGVAYEHARAVVDYCRALSRTPQVYDARLTHQDVQRFVDSVIKETTSRSSSVDWTIFSQKIDNIFECLKDSKNTISFRYDFKTVLKQVLPLIP